jgi:hypothetical protein
VGRRGESRGLYRRWENSRVESITGEIEDKSSEWKWREEKGRQ